MRTIEKNVFTYGELSEVAKENARNWYREESMHDEWWDFVYTDAKQMASLIGIEIEDIYFSGFSSQGDGASFTGTYRYVKGGSKALKAEAPTDKELHRIADQLQAVQRQNFYRLYASVSHRGSYLHSGHMSIDVKDTENCYRDLSDADEDITQLLRDFADWIYSKLNDEYDYLTSDEVVEESILANEYEFSEEGEIA